jgi:hypothetical protein
MLERMRYPVPPEIQQILDEARAGKDKILKDERLKDSAKANLVREVEYAARVRFDAAFEKLHAAQQKELDREEGQIRRQLLDAPPTFDMLATEKERLTAVARQQHKLAGLQAEGNALTMVTLAPDSHELSRLFDEAEARGLESVMAAATFRAEGFATRARQKDKNALSPGPAQQIAVDLRMRLDAFSKANPTLSEQLRAIAGQREHKAAELERAKSWWLRAYGWTGPQSAA